MRYLFPLVVLTLITGLFLYLPGAAIWQWFRLPVVESQKKLDLLTLENESLKAQLLELQLHSRNKVDDQNHEYFLAKIYSTYPFNDRHLFTIAAGADELKVGMPVVAEKNLLLGKVTNVYETYSEVTSIFSPTWQLPVKVGEKGDDGLFVGGPEPKVTMIVGDKDIHTGDTIYSASKDFPYGFKVGEIKNVVAGTSSFFKEATVLLPYDFNQLLEVLVMTR